MNDQEGLDLWTSPRTKKDRIFSHWKLLSVGIEVVLSQEEGKTPGLIYLASVFVRENGLIRYEYEAK